MSPALLPRPAHERADARLDADFEAFHAEHPWVLTELVRLTRHAVDHGQTRVGMKQLFEVLRWERMSSGGGRVPLNNNLTSRYARRIMDAHPDLAGVYETRELRAVA